MDGCAGEIAVWVSIHAPAWGATKKHSPPEVRPSRFQSTHPRGVRQAFPLFKGLSREVSIHAPAWGATRRRGTVTPELVPVSIHAPAWGATRPMLGFLFFSYCFNPRTRVGCDPQRYPQTCAAVNVSIHAPAWGATLRFVYVGKARDLFQSTHPRGVRPSGAQPCSLSRVVSIHAPAWGATGAVQVAPATTGVSIHAPAWGATGLKFFRRPSMPSFNPRTRVGCDDTLHIGHDAVPRFQSTHPRGVRPVPRLAWSPRQYPFQSTHPRGVRRANWRQKSTHTRVSIHAPAWGATAGQALAVHTRRCFNPRTRVGCDAGRVRAGIPGGFVSIHAPAWGATPSGRASA